MLLKRKPPSPVHVRGMVKGEETVLRKGREAGRGGDKHNYRSARDATAIEHRRREPIHPAMPSIPPA